MKSNRPITQDLVLVGGGHSHAIALRLFGMQPLPGVRLTLISEQSDTPYSGMLPGYVAGFYSRDECHIDLRSLCQFAGAQFYGDRVIGLDLKQNLVLCEHRPPIRFDLLSLDIGSTPKAPGIMGNLDAIIPAKPVRQFLEQWNRITEAVKSKPDQPLSLAIVGGGAGGVELALNMQHRIQTILHKAGSSIEHLTLHLIHRDAELLPKHNSWVRQHFQQLLTQRGIQLHLNEEIKEVEPHRLIGRSGFRLNCDHIFWVTQAAAPDWLHHAGLATDADGFVWVDDELRSTSHSQVFAAGDIATMVNHPRPKAGVFAVRQGKPLFHNLRRTLEGRPLRPFHPQKQYLSLIGTGNGAAVASRGPFGWQSPLLWKWKDRIDRQFMEQFSHLPKMDRGEAKRTGKSGEVGEGFPASTVTTSGMRCSGCGAKVGSPVLERVLRRIQSPPPSPLLSRSDILLGLAAADDAAVVQVPAGLAMVQTIDYFPSLINDPFVFGQIAANHALSDLFAMGAEPQSALAIATLPYAQSAVLEETLYQVLSGAVKVLHAAGAELLGGHTTEGAELAFGLSCNGLAVADRLLRKGGLQPGQVLILTKAIGTGALFAAQMQLKAKGRWIDDAIASMLQSNQQAARCFLEHAATACTDITGFGLVGHLLEMLRASPNVAVTLNLETIPLLQGALEVTRSGITSSLYPDNSQAMWTIANLEQVRYSPHFPLLFDPQTSGGLLASVPAEMGDRCLTTLKDSGYTHSHIIGQVRRSNDSEKPITIAL